MTQQAIGGFGMIPPHESTVEWLVDDRVGAAGVSRFTGAGGVEEWHVVLRLNDGHGRDPAAELEARWLATLDAAGISPASTVMRRVFCSDAVNQWPRLGRFAGAHPGAFSAIGQAPTDGGRFAIWSHHIIGPDGPMAGTGAGGFFTCRRGPLSHCWISGLSDTTGEDSFSQSHAILEKHDRFLADHAMTLAGNVVRTWWFVREIDADYQGLVDARRAVFDRHGLTENSHYIASTGIAGTHHDPSAKLSLDSYAIGGLVPGQVEYLSAPEHLGPTHAYGVTFERATAISYADRRHIFISGTASIDAAGDIVHPGDVLRQLDRTLENIAALLAAAGAGFDDLAMILVYVRDPADGRMIESAVRQRLAGLPMVVVHAPVCRPGWLVEIEGVAIVAAREPDLPEF